MSQQLLQPGISPTTSAKHSVAARPSQEGDTQARVRPRTSPHRSHRAEPAPRRETLALRTVGLSLVFTALFAALVFAVGCACLASAQSRREELENELESLRAGNAQLRCSLHLARSPLRIASAAEHNGMRQADPAKEMDYVLLPRENPEARPGNAQARANLTTPPLGAQLFPGLISSHR